MWKALAREVREEAKAAAVGSTEQGPGGGDGAAEVPLRAAQSIDTTQR